MTTRNRAGSSLLFALGFFLLAGCGSISLPGTPAVDSGDTAWMTPKRIAAPITASSATGDIALGDLTKDAVAISIPKGAFTSDMTVEVTNPDTAPKYLGKEMQPLGPPVEISVGKPMRLDEKATVTFAFDKTLAPEGTDTSFLRVVYFDGTHWEYIRPTKVDLTAGTMTFETYHFSLFGGTKITDETKITEQWIHSQTLDNSLRGNINDTTDAIAGKILDMTFAKMGVKDDNVRANVLKDILKDDKYKEIYNAYKAGDVEGMNAKFNILISTKIAENVPESVLSKGLGALAENAEDLEAVSKAAGYVAGGQYKDAAKIIGEQIADKFLITTAAKVAVEVVGYQIETWKSAEVEAAYKAYKDGANATFYGYNVDKGDFPGVWEQMRGIRRQIEIDAIKQENKVREDAGMPPLNEREEERVRTSVEASYASQFATRMANEDKLAKEEEKLKKLVEAFKDANFFDSTLSPGGLDKLDYESKLDVLYHFAQKMLRDTGRTGFTDKTGLLVEGAISYDDIVQGVRAYYGEGGKKAYEKFLTDRYGISFAPELKDLAGAWGGGEMVITDVIVSDEFRKQAEKEGCDISEIEKQKGKKQAISITLNPTSDTGGNMLLKMGDGESKSIPFTYEDGVITASGSEKDATISMDMTVSEEDGKLSSAGSMNINYKDQLKIVGTVGATKDLPKKP